MTDLDRLTTALSDRYTIERELGAGGMATVYLAHDVKHDRKVALKVLRPDLAASLGADRFLREVRIAANLSHPHILPLYDSGEADGFLFYVMPYVEGESLREKLDREGELPIPEATRILKEIADALAYAHEHRVVHRDIKPDNVMLSGRHALVMDFGVAKAVSEATGR
ncbi:MAG: serine/threonine-protein kinase, partial [Gemmatimonadetes bacterium]|nr:serine/threonine-protein kinase [Gemmatimonadota bacterium]